MTKRTFIPIPRSPDTTPAYQRPRTRLVLPSHADRRDLYPPVVDQGHGAGACVTNAFAGHAYAVRKLLGLSDVGTLSRLFCYYNAMVQEAQHRGLRWEDGVAVKSILDTAVSQGICSESLCGYRLADYHKQPSGIAYREAFRHRIPQLYPSGLPAYSCLTQTRDATGQFYDIEAMKACVAFGHTFLFCFAVTDDLRLTADYTLVGPSGPVDVTGDAHCVCAVGYDDSRAAFLCRNSWGDWGYQHGHFFMPYTLIRRPDFAYDAYTVDDLRDLPV